MSSDRPPRSGSSAGKSGGRPPSKPPTRSGGKPGGKPPARSGGKPPAKSSGQGAPSRSSSSRPPSRSSSERSSSDRPKSDYKPRADRPSSDRPKSDYKPRSDRPTSDRPSSDRPKADYKPRTDRPSSDRPKSDYKARTDRPSSDRPKADYKPRTDRPSSDRPKSDYKARTDRPSSDRPKADYKPRTDRPSSDRPKSDYKPRSDRPTSDRPSSDRPKSDYKPRTDRQSSDRPKSDYKPRTDRPSSDRPKSDYKPRTGSSRPDQRPRRDEDRPDTRRPDRNGADRPRDPNLPDEIRADQLDIGVGHELRTLPEGLAEIVARHLVAADQALVDENIPLARQHIAAAKRRAGRVAAVREAAGITAYLAGEYAEAISELRTVRRMTGSNEYLPMMADSERGLGRPQRALELIKEVDARTLDPDTRVELLLVSAGARADLGQLDAALVVLQVPELRNLPPGGTRARMQYAYADLLERVGRFEDAHEWMRQAAESDIDGVTDAAERLEEEAGVSFSEEDDDELVPLDGEGNPQA